MITVDHALTRAAVSIAELRTLTGMSESTIKRDIKSGLIPSIALNGRRLIPASFVRTLFEGIENE